MRFNVVDIASSPATFGPRRRELPMPLRKLHKPTDDLYKTLVFVDESRKNFSWVKIGRSRRNCPEAPL
jgi:hypothetical protein